MRGRAGYAFGNALLYGTAGLALVGFDDDFPLSAALDDLTLGWVAGGGLEYKFSPNWSAGVEALYYDVSSDWDGLGGELERDFWTLKGRVTYHVSRLNAVPLK